MPESFGGSFPTVGIQQGHRHESSTTGLIYRYLGGNPSNIDNWLVDGGRTSTDPDTSSWGTQQIGANWYNTTERQTKSWTGTSVLSTKPATTELVGGVATIDADTGNFFRVVMTEDITLVISGSIDGHKIILALEQDDVGNRTVTWPLNIRFSIDLLQSSAEPNSLANRTTYIGLVFNGKSGKFDALAKTGGFY